VVRAARFAGAAALAGIAGLAGAGCASFEDPTIVLDLRVIAMTAEPPEQVIDVDLSKPLAVDALITELEPTRVCAYIADPGEFRALHSRMIACLLDENSRCDPAGPQILLGEETLDDPEDTSNGGQTCARIDYAEAPSAWAALLRDTLEADPTRGLGGLDYAISLQVGEDGGPPEQTVEGVKRVRLSPRIPDTRVANHNPSMNELQLSRNNGVGQNAMRAHCANTNGGVFRVSSGDVVTLFPVEPTMGVREEFIVPTIDGGFEKFTETLSYQWLAAAGSFSDAITGGPPDVFGNQALLGTDWTAPEVGVDTDVAIWVIQRDERLGVSVRETCIRVGR
jgi:hypothetical protein